MTGPGLRILVAGSFASPPGQGGATWAVLQYALGLRQLGHEVLLVDPCPGSTGAAGYLERIRPELDPGIRAALVHPDRSATGIDYQRVAEWAAGADLLVNLAGVLRDEELLAGPDRRVYVDLDPAFTQLWNDSDGIDMGLAGHDRHFTVGGLIGTATCAIPTCGLAWTPTRPPVVMSEWPAAAAPPGYGLTTVANWRSYGTIVHGGVTYGQKAHSLRRIIDLPGRVPQARFQPALAIDAAETADLAGLDAGGWDWVDAATVAATPGRYRRFVSESTAELGVAKAGYVTSRCGWFSDRSACYLAAGRPVVAQDTGWTALLPAGDGLLAFSDSASAQQGIEAVIGDYRRHARAARELAGEYFDSKRVLEPLLDP